METDKRIMDEDTKKYIKSIQRLQFITMGIICVLFFAFARIILLENNNNLKKVALAEVQESMRETISNLTVHIDRMRADTEQDAGIDVVDLANRIQAGGVTSLDELLSYLEVCEENQLAQAIEVLYTTDDTTVYYVNAYDRDVVQISKEEAEKRYEYAPVCDFFEVNGQQIVLFINQCDIDLLVKEEIRNYIHSETYEGNQYVWVNEVLNMDGGDNYAIRRIHPNLVELEGEYLSTSMQDVKGNFPYKVELEGIRKDGSIFHCYYFKNKTDDKISEKYSYAQYYEPFSWIIATGETIEEVYAYSEKLNEHSIEYMLVLMLAFSAVFVLTTGLITKVLGKQARGFQEKILKQNEVYEEMYTTMSVGMLRVRMTKTESSIMHINPTGLELLGIDSEKECQSCIHGHMLETMLPEDAERLTKACEELEEQWAGCEMECHVTWKDGSVHLLRIRNLLVEYDGEVKIIQRLCQDITEERYQHEQALIAAEEKATLDPMTQIKNKKAIENIIRERIIEAAKKNLSVTVGFVDIDNFRDYNTKYGHLQGDEVIKFVADTLRDHIPGVVGRNGGDEFAFCTLETPYEEIEDAMKCIHKKLNEGIVILGSDEKIATPCSIGVVIEQSSALHYDYVMKRSDMAMYEAKANGKNTYVILDETTRGQA